ncbi:MAG: DUF190 domain-containing protein [Geobacteraceae bacterium]|nr:DUF190 domain-containing protein [Geobacteraceae bacterium]
METPDGQHFIMRIFIAESDRHQHRPLHEALVELLRTEGFAGATVLRGISGFGAHGICHSQKLLDLSADLPIIVEAIDRKEKIDAIMPRVEAMMTGGMVTLQEISVLLPG